MSTPFPNGENIIRHFDFLSSLHKIDQKFYLDG